MRSGGAGGAAGGGPVVGAAISGPFWRLCFPGRYYEYMFGQSGRRRRGRRPLGARAGPELSQLQVVIEASDPGCHSYPHLASSEACEYRAAVPAFLSPFAYRVLIACFPLMSSLEVSRLFFSEELEFIGSLRRSRTLHSRGSQKIILALSAVGSLSPQ